MKIMFFIAIGIIATVAMVQKTASAVLDEPSAITPEVVETVEEERVFVLATITAYTSSVDETDDTPFETASGSRTRDGIVACPPKYEFGTKIYIKGKEYLCEDRMNRRYHDQERFDMWIETKAEAFDWGVRELLVEVKQK